MTQRQRMQASPVGEVDPDEVSRASDVAQRYAFEALPGDLVTGAG
jgi:hypothetical protein